MISRTNYEIYFIDYFDGKLDETRQEELFDFLKTNPDLQEEFNLFSEFQVKPETEVQFSGRDRLKKDTITLFNYKTWLTGYVENDLTAKQIKEVDLFLTNNPTLKPELEILKQTKVTPDHRIVFENKKSLRKGGKIVYFNKTLRDILSTAAVLLLVALAYYLIRQNNTPQNEISSNPNKKENIIISSDEKENKEFAENPGKENRVKKPVIQKMKPIERAVPLPDEQRIKSVEPYVTPDNEISREEVLPDTSIKTVINNPSSEFAGIKSVGMGINFHATIHIEVSAIRFKQINLSQNNINDVFNEEDLKELEELQKSNQEKAQANTKTLLDLASEKIIDLSKSANITVEKQNDDSGKLVTYALGVGKNFSVSHTRAR